MDERSNGPLIEVRALKQCINCSHKRVCEFKKYFKELQNIFMYKEDIKACRSLNFKLLRLFKIAQIPDEILDIPTLFVDFKCPEFEGGD